MYEINLTLLNILVDHSFWGMADIHATAKCTMLWKTGLVYETGKYTEIVSRQLP